MEQAFDNPYDTYVAYLSQVLGVDLDEDDTTCEVAEIYVGSSDKVTNDFILFVTDKYFDKFYDIYDNMVNEEKNYRVGGITA